MEYRNQGCWGKEDHSAAQERRGFWRKACVTGTRWYPTAFSVAVTQLMTLGKSSPACHLYNKRLDKKALKPHAILIPSKPFCASQRAPNHPSKPNSMLPIA